ncbi:MAG: dihydrolipoamide acetyltransferase family protein [Gemmatimonadota bacterium]|nr:dihydrolipoamide acetyltransferase family protein [Gemmatimonadota bacterium]
MARIEVPMPQMGESITEGTVSRWLKEVGQPVERDEPILEISTDKVDAEIPAPADGLLAAIEVQEGQTVEVGTIVAYIDTEARSGNGGAPEAGPDSVTDGAPGPDESEESRPEPGPGRSPTAGTVPGETTSGQRAAGAAGTAVGRVPESGTDAEPDRLADAGTGDRRRSRSTPLVRRIAAEHGVDLDRVPGTGQAGRVTKRDILSYIESGKLAEDSRAAREAPDEAAESEDPRPAPTSSDLWKTFYGQVQHPEFPVRDGDRVEPMDKIRRLTAEHMVVAKRVAAHVHSVIEIDFTAVDRVRTENKRRWQERGARVSYTAFVAWAAARVLREFPKLNATISGDDIVYRGAVNLGVAVDLDPGLIVPVLCDADHMSLIGVGIKIADLAERARTRQLSPDEIQGATFTITNPGVLGTLVGMPVIPKGTAAILGTGAIDKRVVAIEDPETGADAVAIRKRALFSLGYDHRLVDGAESARFLLRLKEFLEDFPADA